MILRMIMKQPVEREMFCCNVLSVESSFPLGQYGISFSLV
jgi:hypothetical protein